MIALRVGALVEHNSVPGTGRVGAIDGARIRVDYFESVDEPVLDSHWVDSAECNHVRLQRDTRAYWQDPDTGVWRAGRNASCLVSSPGSQCDLGGQWSIAGAYKVGKSLRSWERDGRTRNK